jgi:hypothetical protein
MEEIIERHKQELLKHGVHESEDKDEDWGEHQELEDDVVKEEDDSLDDGDLNYINAILESFAKPKSKSDPTSAFNYAMLTPEGAPTQAPAKQKTPPEINHKINQNFNKNSTSECSGAENFSCITIIWEEGHTELADYYSDKEEDDSLDNKDTRRGRITGNKFNLEELSEISDEEETWSEAEQDEFDLENQNEVDYEEPGVRTTFTGISSLSVETAQAFSAWQPYIPREHACRSLSAQSWWSDSSPQVSLSQEPTLTQISSIRSMDSTIGPTPALMKMNPSKWKMS